MEFGWLTGRGRRAMEVKSARIERVFHCGEIRAGNGRRKTGQRR